MQYELIVCKVRSQYWHVRYFPFSSITSARKQADYLRKINGWRVMVLPAGSYERMKK